MNNQQKKRRVTQGDVAKKANVSQAMVSYVVNNNSSITIPDETRQRILDAMDELGYVPNITARRLRSSKTYTIAGIIPDITNPFYPAFERGIQDVVNQNNYDLIIYNTDGDAAMERKCLESMMQGRVDGIVGVFFHIRAMELINLIEQGLSVVRLEAMPKMPGSVPLDNIYIDNIAASRAAVEYLIGQGHTRIGMLTSKEGPARFREMGYREAMLAHQITIDPELTRIGEYSEDGGYQAMTQLLALSALPTAIFAANDLMAMGAMLAIREKKLAIPDDIAVMGFDDIPTAKLVYPSLSTVAQSQREMGRTAAKMLFERLEGTAPEHGRSQEMPFELIIRDST
ncbi:MAG: LacI family DNA-binding transcriptional regulator [Anaerolineaceae bacterium]|nr:LacI family DNA-binding transcriptional regulator [Anaerolineaceae bacterium]